METAQRKPAAFASVLIERVVNSAALRFAITGSMVRIRILGSYRDTGMNMQFISGMIKKPPQAGLQRFDFVGWFRQRLSSSSEELGKIAAPKKLQPTAVRARSIRNRIDIKHLLGVIDDVQVLIGSTRWSLAI